LARARIVPIIVIDDVAAASALAAALVAGGLRCAEVTLRTPAAIGAIARFADNADLVVGAGTVLDPDQASAAVDAGARFIVSPGFDSEVVQRCRQLGVPVLPGTATPTDIQQARRAGLRTVKFFPAETLGGVAALDAISAPFPGMMFVPTGGITGANVAAYLRHRAVLAVGGSWMAPRRLIASGDWRQVGQLAAAAAELAADSRGAAIAGQREARP
jgi:2-dehydro-3-deoxyphosphogluconate aldolase/(4S)-4-hydroxy-2-oxoglutarate aldolase